MDTDKAGNDITTAQAFRDVNKDLTGKNNAISFVRADILLEKLKSLAELGRNTLGTAKPEVAKKGSAMLDSLVYPVLDGLKMFKSVGTRAVIRESEIEMTSCSKIED